MNTHVLGTDMTMTNKTLLERFRTRDLRVLNRGPTVYTVSNALHYGVRAALGKSLRRDVSFVAEEYEHANRTEYWRGEVSLDELIYSDNRTSKWIIKDGELSQGSDRDVREFLLDRLRQRVREVLPEGRGRVVEFGTGTGRNLFFLAREFPNMKFAGIELSKSTADAARERAKREGLDVEFFVGDMTKDCSHVGKADMVFTIHALEQLPAAFTSAVDNMIALRPKKIVLFEPVHELFPKTLRGMAARLRLRSANYLDGLLRYLKSHRGVSIEHAAAMRTVGNPLNQTSEIVVRVAAANAT